MFLSKVTLNPRSSGVYRLLSDLYRQHQFVLSAFPDADAGGVGSVLYRVETTESGSQAALLVQSAQEPDWEQVMELHPDVIKSALAKSVSWEFAEGTVLRFRLRANPTMMKVVGDITKREGHKRVGLYKEEEQRDWLARQAERNGFTVSGLTVRSLGKLTGNKPNANGKPHPIICHLVDFDGVLTVTDAAAFHTALQTGVGRGKAWGAGLLSLARV